MSDAMSRRTLLKNSAALAGTAGLAGPFFGLAERALAAKSIKAPNNGGYGPLRAVRDRTTGEYALQLPRDFTYHSFSAAGDIMSNGKPTPARHDGMAAFTHPKHKDWCILTRNHEQNVNFNGGPFATPSFSPDGAGGVTNLIYDLKHRELVAAHPVLSGTVRNCNGGQTPWRTWLTCEETSVLSSGVQHGWIFEVPADATEPIQPEPLTDLGLMVHEAAPVDPNTGIVYLTEDTEHSGVYRFTPRHYGDLRRGGVLEMMAIKHRPQSDLTTGQTVGEKLDVTWVRIEDPTPSSFADNPEAVFEEGWAKGGARFVGNEGAKWTPEGIAFASSPGGDAGLGQIWLYTPHGKDGGKLRLLFESKDKSVLDGPDNITVAPSGAITICEDGEGDPPSTVDNYVRGLTTKGQIFDFALNLLPNDASTEFAGATWSPDGSTLFVNLLGTALTYAIAGPFQRGAFGDRHC